MHAYLVYKQHFKRRRKNHGKRKLIRNQTWDNLTHAKNKLKNTENDLWLNTNFKKLGYTNKDTRKAYVENEIRDLKLEKDLIHNDIVELRRELDLCDDKIKLLSI